MKKNTNIALSANKNTKRVSRAICAIGVITAFLLTAAAVSAEETVERERNQAISISPLTILGLAFSSPSSDNPLDYVWFGVDYDVELPNNMERTIGMYAQPNRYGLRANQRYYTGTDHSGFFYGFYGLLEYQRMFWKYSDDALTVTTQTFGHDPDAGTAYHGVGLTAGGTIGFRVRNRYWGATLYGGAGLPLFYCFGDIPAEEDLVTFYALNALNRCLEIGLKIDFYF